MSERVSQETLIHTPRCLVDADAIWNAAEPRGWGKRMSRVRISHKDNAISHLNINHAGTESFYDSNSLAAQGCGKLRLAWIRTTIETLADKFSAALLDIEKINAGSLDLQ